MTDMITIPREAVQQVLEALESRCGTNAEERRPDGVITALREALAQPAKPLTDEQIDNMVIGVTKHWIGKRQIARAIEAAHGIKENT